MSTDELNPHAEMMALERGLTRFVDADYEDMGDMFCFWSPTDEEKLFALVAIPAYYDAREQWDETPNPIWELTIGLNITHSLTGAALIKNVCSVSSGLAAIEEIINLLNKLDCMQSFRSSDRHKIMRDAPDGLVSELGAIAMVARGGV